MYRSSQSGKRTVNLAEAFKKDDFEIKKIIKRFDRTGIMVESTCAVNYDTGRRKKAYYIEGSAYQMGFLLGSLAEGEIASMSQNFADKVVFAFIGSRVLERIKILQEALILMIYELSRKAFANLPQELKDELRGVYDGCRSFNPNTKVDMEHLIALNLGIDTICSMVYPGDFSFRSIAGPHPLELKIPFMCNAFSVFGNLAGGGHFFGRDFMFPTAGVFQDTAAMIICNPVAAGEKTAYPFVSVSAPGIIGSISGMNIKGVAMGVDMSPAANCSPGKLGINSLLMVRYCTQYGGSAADVVDIMRKTPRGVSWNYVVSDGGGDRACVIEAGTSEPLEDILKFPAEDVRPYLPDRAFLDSHSSGVRDGLAVRWENYLYPEEYLSYNEGLWNFYNRINSTDKVIYDDSFSEKGFINKNGWEKNCPSSYYFAPQREKKDGLVIATNHYITPEMRYYAMHPWTAQVTGDTVNDIQWRYDELNRRINDVLDRKGRLDWEDVRNTISFLSPYGDFPSYYAGNPKSRDGKEIRIEGCTSLFDLKNRVIESHYGYYRDNWVRLALPNYFPG